MKQETNKQPQSWGELIKTVETETRHKSVIDHPDYKGAVERNVTRSKLNPVQMKFVDENKEREYMTMRLKREMDKCTKDLELKSNRFDVINHNGPPRKPIPSKKNVNGRVDRNWRLLSLVGEEDHKSLSIFYDESIHDKQRQLNNSMSVPSIDNAALRRPFNILSNSYVDNDDLVREQESESLREHIKEKYWQTHNFDPIHSQYFDYKKEQEMKDKERKLVQSKERRKLASLTPSILSSEGVNYNIIIQEDWANKSDLIKPNLSMVKKERLLNRLKHSEDIISDQKYRGDLTHTIKDNRSIQRINHARWSTQLNREFDIVNNQIKDHSYQPYVPAPVSIWDKVTTTSNSNNNYNYSNNTTMTAIPSTASSRNNIFSPIQSTRSSLMPQTTDRGGGGYTDTSRNRDTSRNTDRLQIETERLPNSYVPKLAFNSTASF